MDLPTRKKEWKFFAGVILIFMLLSSQSECMRPKKCHKKRYNVEISPPGIPSCRKVITVVKCEGYCESQTKPYSSPRGIYFRKICSCCQPRTRRERKVTFPCGSTVEILQIKRCDCLPC